MDEPLAVALKFGFLAVLYLFLLWIARSSMRDLSRYDGGTAVAKRPEPRRGRTAHAPAPDLAASREARLEVVAAMGYEAGTTFDLGDGVTLGRSDAAEIRVEDQFASSAHARIYSRAGRMYVEDLGSTNGTYLNGRQIKAAEPLGAADVIRIGDTEYRYVE